MVFVVKYINYMYPILTTTILFILITTTNSAFQLFSQNVAYASTQQHEDSTSENSDDDNEGNKESETRQGNINPEQTENDTEENSNDFSQSDQNNRCPDASVSSNIHTYIGTDGCKYPCTSSDSINQDNIPESCLVKSSSQSSAGFSVNEENPIKPEQQTTKPSQQNIQTTPSQNAFVNPGINSDTSTGVSNPETTTTQKSFNPTGKLRSGPGQTESSIPSLSYDPTKPYEMKANPYCIEGSFDGTLHTVQAPGSVGIKVVSTNFDLVQTSDCNFDIYPKESKSCLVQFINFLKPK